MVLFIGPLTPVIKNLQKNISESKVIENVCHLNLSDQYDIYIIDKKINDYGLIEKTDILLDELLLIAKVNKIYCQNVDIEILKKFTDYYGVEVYSL